MPKNLPINWQKAIYLRTEHNLSTAVIATRLSCTISSINMHFFRNRIPKVKTESQHRNQVQKCVSPHCDKLTRDKYCYKCFYRVSQIIRRHPKQEIEPMNTKTIEVLEEKEAESLTQLHLVTQTYEE